MNTRGASPSDASGASPVSSSEPTQFLWLRILLRCVAVTAPAFAGIAAVALLVSGGSAALSALFGWLIVALFFGISLLVGHFAGRGNPSGAIGLFAVTYAIKVVGFAAVLFLVGVPAWLDRNWFFGSAVGSVVLWQVVEIAVFARARHQLYGDRSASNPVVDGHA